MEAMARPRPQYLQRELTRHGKVVWYVRIDDGKRTRIRAEYGTPEFQAEYQDAINGTTPDIKKPKTNTFAWLVARYRESMQWNDLSAATRRQRENILKHVLERAGKDDIADFDKDRIIAGRDRRKETPAQARHFVDTMRGVFRFAVDAGHATTDPTQGVIAKKPKTKGFPVWTDEDIEAFEKRWPRGTRERVMFDVFLYTGLRRGDAAKLGKQHVRDGRITIDTEKTGTRVTIPLLPELAETLKAGPVGDLAFIATTKGASFKKESLGTVFKQACKAAGIKTKSAHGLRKAAATHAANNGATVAQLEAIFGWEGGQMASLYTRSANRKALADASMDKLSRRTK